MRASDGRDGLVGVRPPGPVGRIAELIETDADDPASTQAISGEKSAPQRRASSKRSALRTVGKATALGFTRAARSLGRQALLAGRVEDGQHRRAGPDRRVTGLYRHDDPSL
jgi:hypothetical protein